ncbi:MAG TPA: PQQ-binding-like beta-propeller repeat protein [Streptosporangiaceae bacterium]|nr:PQQ-binding-like beta-propeller repeat protein [Streptosporangiaceae bacterium]
MSSGEHLPARRGIRAAATLATAGATAGAFVVWTTVHTGKTTVPPPTHRHSSMRVVSAPKGLPAVESGLLPWHLATPVSREVAVAGAGDQLVVLGGLKPSGASDSGVFAVHTATGRVKRLGALAGPLHDAAAALVGQRALVFGGGTVASVTTVQAFTLGGQRGTAATVGSLPQRRSDSVTVTVSGTTYLIGGYDGAHPDATVLATANGATFATAATLPVPVRYPAAAALGGQIYVFGGLAITGPKAGKPVDVIQAIDPATHRATVIGHLPEPLTGATAATVGGEVLVAGGDSPAPQGLRPGVGATQLSPGEASAPTGGDPGTTSVATIWAFDPATRGMLSAGRLQVPVAHAAVAVSGSTAWIVGGESNGSLVSAVQMMHPDRAFGTAGAPGAGSPYFGAQLLIADRGNDRLLLLDSAMHLTWKYPSAKTPHDPLGFYFPDDAFFVNHGSAIISNQEQNNTIVEIAYPSGKIFWTYGHPRQPGTARGYLHEPDDAYLLKNGQITVADADNCRVLVINKNRTVADQIGTNGRCWHSPPRSMGTPNGDTPLPDGNLLISEINGSWVSEYTTTGKLVWTAKLPISYPSDPQQLGSNRYLIADYSLPGQILEFNRQGRILYRYRAATGPGMLDHPSLTELLPSGVFMANDDYNHRMVAIDPVTHALVWQYGVTGRPGRGPGMLNTPDGFDILLPNGSTPTHPTTG